MGSEELLNHFIARRMAAVHPLCNDAKYGEQGEKAKDGSTDVEMTREQKQKLESRRKESLRVNKDERHSPRIDVAMKFIREHLQNEKGKVVIFCPFLSAPDLLALGLSATEGVGEPLRFDGTKLASQRDAIVREFQADEE